MIATAPCSPICPGKLHTANPAYQDLSDQQVLALAVAGDDSARWTLFDRADNTIRTRVHRYVSGMKLRGAISEEDLLAASRQVAAEAVLKWKPAGAHLAAYIATTTVHECKRVVAWLGAHVPVERTVLDEAIKLEDQREELERELGRPPRMDELTERTNELAKRAGKQQQLSEYEVSKRLSVVRPPITLQPKDAADGQETAWRARAVEAELLTMHGDSATSDDPCTILTRNDERAYLQAVVCQLPAEEWVLITGTFGLDGQPELSWEELAAVLGMSRATFGKFKKATLNRLLLKLKAEFAD